MTATAELDLLDEFSERPVSKVDRSLVQKTARGSFGSILADRSLDLAAAMPSSRTRFPSSHTRAGSASRSAKQVWPPLPSNTPAACAVHRRDGGGLRMRVRFMPVPSTTASRRACSGHRVAGLSLAAPHLTMRATQPDRLAAVLIFGQKSASAGPLSRFTLVIDAPILLDPRPRASRYGR